MNTAVEISDLSVAFSTPAGTVHALNGLSLEVRTGQIFGFLGPNGSGKTTTMHVLLGFVQPSSGSAHIFGHDVQKSIARQRIGYLPEHPDTYRFLTGTELLNATGKLFCMKGGILQKRITEVLELTGIKDAADRRISTYSRGMMQRICFAQALINDPDLIILDEPTGGLDPFGRMATRDILMLLKERGKTVFFSSHELSEVELICDHIAIISRGRIITEGPVKDFVKHGENLEKFFINTVNEDRKSS